MTMTDEHPLGSGSDAPLAARDAVNSMIEAWLLDRVMPQVDAGGLTLTGDGTCSHAADSATRCARRPITATSSTSQPDRPGAETFV